MHDAARRRYIEQLAEGNRRSAKAHPCTRCGEPIITGDDHDEVALVVHVDAEPLDLIGEMLAVLDGRATYSLERQTGKDAPAGASCLWARETWHLDSTKPPRGTLHATHECKGSDRDLSLFAVQ